ncbi:MAG TPA: hypothetical protein VED17_10020 [Nitrososphaerales archaeon]|nr:hypothetical protein [Nitrososphaerales archaeon]
MQHFLNLEKCNCGAYRYLAVREHKKSYEIYLIHHLHFSNAQNVRKYSKLASIPKFRINIHNQRVEEETKQKTIQLNFDEAAVLKSVLRKLECGIETLEESSNLERSKDLAEDIPAEVEESIVALP